MAVKSSDLVKLLTKGKADGYDFAILLNQEICTNEAWNEERMSALLDHELVHCELARDPKTQAIKRDECGNPVYRIRGHDIEEFREIVERHGLWKSDLESFAESIKAIIKAPLLGVDQGNGSTIELKQAC